MLRTIIVATFLSMLLNAVHAQGGFSMQKYLSFLIIIIKLATKTENNKLKLNCLKLIFSLIWFDLIWFVYFILLTVHTFFFSIDQIKISLILHEFLLSWFEKVFKCLLWFLQKN